MVGLHIFSAYIVKTGNSDNDRDSATGGELGNVCFIITNTWVLQSRGVESHTQTSLIVDGLAVGKVEADGDAVRQL